MRMIAAVAFSTAVLFSPLFAAAQEAPAAAPVPAAATANAAPMTATTPAATATAAPTTAASAGAAMPAPAATAAADSSAVNLDEVVCRSVAAPTGSRLGGGRECHTVREWNQRERQSQDLTRQQERTGFAVHGG